MTNPEGAPARQTDPFSLVTVAALIGVGITAFCAFLFLAAYPPDARDQGGGGSALSDSSVGFAAAVDLLKELGTPVSISRADPAKAAGSLVILTPRASPGAVPLALLDYAATPTLIVLPKWSVGADRDHPGWVVRRGLPAESAVAAALPVRVDLYRRSGMQSVVLHGGDGPLSNVKDLALAPMRDLQLIDTSSHDWSPALLTDTGGTILAHYMQGHGRPVYVLSDPDLLNTQGLKSPQTARAAVTILDGLRRGAPVAFDVTLNGFGGTPNLLRLLFEPPLLGATVCAAVAALLIIAMAVRRFGPAIEPPRVLDFGKRALADNAAALIALAGREPRMTRPYADLIRAQALRDIGAPPRAGRAEADRLLEAAGRVRGLPDTCHGLMHEAYGTATRAEALAVAARLFAWGKGLRRGYR